MDIKTIQESFSPYSGLNLITRCIYLSRKKPDFSPEAMKMALKECIKCGYTDLHKAILAQTISWGGMFAKKIKFNSLVFPYFSLNFQFRSAIMN